MKKLLLTSLSIFFFAGASVNALRAENVGVPSECEDVMLQAFYWDSYVNVASGSATEKYGRTKWVDLRKDTSAIRNNFDLVWFPPSAVSTGGVGYYHTCLSNQGDGDGTAWGTKARLVEVIAALHRGNTKVIGDIVINHRGNSTSWCTFYPDDFGTYGQFQLTQKHMCYGDEGFTNSSSSCYNAAAKDRGAADTGTNDGGCRDLDHSSEYVQKWAKAYVQWMLAVMKYDGFRYDMTRGYAGKYLKMYNEASQPYFSVSEYWMDNISDQLNHLKATEYNTLVFDFAQRSKVNYGIRYNYYSYLVRPSNSFRGQGYSRYAVTFIDNHDTFERSDNQGAEFMGYKADLSNSTVKNKILQANAYILMLPGVPCVFWPHWKSYQNEINAMIAVRKRAGIHSESAVSDESYATGMYTATIQGHRGRVILRLGANRSAEVPEGYELAVEGGSNGDYTIFYMDAPQGLDDVTNDKASSKFIKDGQLFIRHGEKVYDILGREVK